MTDTEISKQMVKTYLSGGMADLRENKLISAYEKFNSARNWFETYVKEIEKNGSSEN